MKTRSPSARATLQKCVDLLRRKHYALTTEQSYCQHIGSYIDWLRDVQELLGHAILNTTMIYVHGDGERVRSPLSAMPLPANVVPFESQQSQQNLGRVA
jgi:hypothetical protein